MIPVILLLVASVLVHPHPNMLSETFVVAYPHEVHSLWEESPPRGQQAAPQNLFAGVSEQAVERSGYQTSRLSFAGEGWLRNHQGVAGRSVLRDDPLWMGGGTSTRHGSELVSPLTLFGVGASPQWQPGRQQDRQPRTLGVSAPIWSATNGEGPLPDLHLPAPVIASAPDELSTPLAEYRQGVFLAALTDINGPYRAPPPPPTTTTAAPRRSNYGSGVEQWRGLVSEYFGSETDTALAIMKCESRGDPNAQNRRSSAAGLFQILKGTWAAFSPYPWSDRYHPRANVHTAKRIRDGQGWQAWSCYG